ncbi:M13 family metallopeptidase [Aggregicoccus sp. 17bor-14]|uniref:M13 family metallopeptidase n=1 Tax=Myxococcaceae TaxID=31 RepID=UPI00129C17F8|nr:MULTISPECIES: M13 family metallopeptidase [Myxococcaceae]MBF5043396.1 M13 family metallopeptidase [Simulacricoccus sp. 17bor-14]MRI89154.1 M13 family metallopeptidase [Aggregicoccus sp. 17bor-14]
MKHLSLVLALGLGGFSAAAQAQTFPPGVDQAGIDKSVTPGDDFFAYANGAWVKATQIPADRSSWGIGEQLTEKTAAEVAELIKAAQTAPAGSEARKVGDYYAAFMDEKTIEARGLAPLKPALARIAAIRNKTDLARAFGQGLRADVDALNNTDFYTDNLFGLWVEQDLHKPGVHAPYLLQGGLGMPDREYYVATSDRMAKIRDAYKAHLATVLTLMGHPDPQGTAQRIFELETKLARAHATRAESEDVKKADNRWATSSFKTRARGLDWTTFFAAAGLQARREFYVWHPKAVAGEAALVASEPLETWKDYLALHLVEHHAAYLPRAFADERFAFYSKTLRGVPEQRVRWKRGVDATSDSLGMAVGKLYVARYFPPSSKAAVEQMVKALMAAFDKRIDGLDWMAPATKAEAKRKLAALKVGVGYPDHWIDYSTLTVQADDAVGNLDRAELFEYRRNLAKFGHPVDHGEWVMNPQLVNAVNLPVRNALNFPAAILQPPYFDPASPAAVNFGATGATIGHEISHSFDDQGAQFDSQGLLRNWWTRADFAHFEASGKALAAQFSTYRPFPDLVLNGEQVLSENIADLAGLNAAYDAYRIANGGKAGPAARGLDGDQQFFLAFAQSWRSETREATLRQQVITDGHAPDQYRAQTVRNMDPWYAAFDVKPGQALYLEPKDRVRVW